MLAVSIVSGAVIIMGNAPALSVRQTVSGTEDGAPSFAISSS
ncbi:MAG TPA: hypothetical protein RWO66_09825 [Ruminococcus sp.]